jgi:hypothetical protein
MGSLFRVFEVNIVRCERLIGTIIMVPFDLALNPVWLT